MENNQVFENHVNRNHNKNKQQDIIFPDIWISKQRWRKRTNHRSFASCHNTNFSKLLPRQAKEELRSDHIRLAREGFLELQPNDLYCKITNQGQKIPISFLNQSKFSLDAKNFLAKAKLNSEFDYEKHCNIKDIFGLIVLESAQDLPPIVAYIFAVKSDGNSRWC